MPPGAGVPRRRVAERLERGDPAASERSACDAAHPGDEREMVVVDPLLPAEMPEVADPAVVARPAVRLGLGRERGEEPLAHAPVVGVELVDTERLALAAAVLDVDALDRRRPEIRCDLLGVEEELQHVGRLRAARELRVDGLVAAVRLPLEEVREPAPAAVLGTRYGW